MKVVINLSKLPDHTNKVYVPYYTNRSRYLVLYGGAGSGKSVFAAQKILYRILVERKHNFLIVRKVAKTLRHSTFALFTSLISSWNLSRFFKINKTDMTIENILNGNSLTFLGLDDSEKLKSIVGITGIWIEEASEISKNDFTQLNLRLRGRSQNYKQIILTFNPISSEHWLKKHFFDNKIDKSSILKTTYKDNRFIDDEYREVLEKLKEENFEYYKIYALGEWGILKGVIYDNYELIDSFPNFSFFDELIYGVDFGFNNPSAVVLVGIKDGECYIKELFYKTKTTNPELIEILKEEFPFLKKINGYLDSAEPDRIKEFKKNGFRVFPAKKEVKDGIDTVKSKKLYITKDSSNILKEIKNYVWKEDKDGNPIDEPVKFNDHAMDAMRYAIHSYFKKFTKSLTTKIKGI